MNIWIVGGAFVVGFSGSAYMANLGLKGAVRDLEGQMDQTEASARQTRQDVASIVWVLSLTNGLLAGILGVLAFG